jgi:hypothetical protein
MSSSLSAPRHGDVRGESATQHFAFGLPHDPAKRYQRYRLDFRKIAVCQVMLDATTSAR